MADPQLEVLRENYPEDVPRSRKMEISMSVQRAMRSIDVIRQRAAQAEETPQQTVQYGTPINTEAPSMPPEGVPEINVDTARTFVDRVANNWQPLEPPRDN